MIGIPKNQYAQIWKPLQTLFPWVNWHSFQFFVRGSSGNSQNVIFCWFWLGKMHQNGLSGTYLGFKACHIQCCSFHISASLYAVYILNAVHNFRQKIHILLILTGKNASKLFEWHIFRVQGMPNPMALLASLYNMRFMKNHNFWWHITGNGVQNHENGMGQMQQSSLGPILPLHHVSEPYILTFHNNAEKP